ncbi:MAG: PhoH family protein, partial [Selenomonadales bacterium]|nr:PhoH family protein [Selenomonadales bacterium]
MRGDRCPAGADRSRIRGIKGGFHLPQTVEKTIVFRDRQEETAILGNQDEHLNQMAREFSGQLVSRGGQVVISGVPEEVEQMKQTFDELLYLYRQGSPVTMHEVKYTVGAVAEGEADALHTMFGDTILTTARGRAVKAKTLGQWRYIEAIRKNHITFGIGPAGTGKTYLAVAMAVHALKNKMVDRIILTRPAVEAGEKLGFLPGDMQEKVDPYLRPLYDALGDIMGQETFQKYLLRGTIEVAPLAYMRGRTLEDAFIILDEAQNTTPQQMKMFLTRFGFGSKMVVTGDLTQTDLLRNVPSGLKQAQKVLAKVPGIACLTLDEKDVIRHEVV